MLEGNLGTRGSASLNLLCDPQMNAEAEGTPQATEKNEAVRRKRASGKDAAGTAEKAGKTTQPPAKSTKPPSKTTKPTKKPTTPRPGAASTPKPTSVNSTKMKPGPNVSVSAACALFSTAVTLQLLIKTQWGGVEAAFPANASPAHGLRLKQGWRSCLKV